MKLYRITNWNETYENNRTRELKSMAWVPVPNTHDGDGYTTLVDRKNGAAILGAWLVILQVASKCEPRGTLVRDGGKPHDARSLSRMTRLPEQIIKEAIEICSIETQWLEIAEVAEESQDDAEIPQDGAEIPQDGDYEGKGREWKEGKGMEPASPSTSQEDFFAECRSNPAYTGIDVDREWHKMSAWCLANRQKPTRRRFVNWLNRADKPLAPYRNPNIPPGYSGASCL